MPVTTYIICIVQQLLQLQRVIGVLRFFASPAVHAHPEDNKISYFYLLRFLLLALERSWIFPPSMTFLCHAFSMFTVQKRKKAG
jgi:hypothetical protein